MAEANRPLRIIIASPGDCAAEREVVRRVAKQDPGIQALCRNMGTSIDVFGWEDVLPDLGRPQSHINDAIRAFDPDGFVFIFWHRFGSDAGLGMTGSEEEWSLAVQMHEEGGGHPWVGLYFNRADPPFHELDGTQFTALKKFRDDIFAQRQALASYFHSTNDFEELLSLNVKEAQYALEVLDRKPTQENHPQPRRRHRLRSS